MFCFLTCFLSSELKPRCFVLNIMRFWFGTLWNYKTGPIKTVEPAVINSHVGGIFSLEIWMLWQLVFANTRIHGPAYYCTVLSANMWFYGLHLDVMEHMPPWQPDVVRSRKAWGSLQGVQSMGQTDPSSVHGPNPNKESDQSKIRKLEEHSSSFIFMFGFVSNCILTLRFWSKTILHNILKNICFCLKSCMRNVWLCSIGWTFFCLNGLILFDCFCLYKIKLHAFNHNSSLMFYIYNHTFWFISIGCINRLYPPMVRSQC